MKKNRPIRSFEMEVYHHYRIIHGIRVAVSFVITFLLMRIVTLPDHSWILITVVVVMGPVSFMGNVVPRATERVTGTLIGAFFGIISLQMELYSLTLLILWCGLSAFLCGYLVLGKRPYAALLIVVTMAVVSSAPTGDIETALWRSTNIILGCILAMFFTSIYPQRAFINWRIRLADFLTDYLSITMASMSHNVLNQPVLTKLEKRALSNLVTMRNLITPVCNETKIPEFLLHEIHTLTRDLLATQRLQINACWASRESRFLLLNSPALYDMEKHINKMINELAMAINEGDPSPIISNSERLSEITNEIHCLLLSGEYDGIIESSVHGYVWLTVQTAIQLEKLSSLITEFLTDLK